MSWRRVWWRSRGTMVGGWPREGAEFYFSSQVVVEGTHFAMRVWAVHLWLCTFLSLFHSCKIVQKKAVIYCLIILREFRYWEGKREVIQVGEAILGVRGEGVKVQSTESFWDSKVQVGSVAGGETPEMVEMRSWGSQAFRLGGLWKNLKQKNEISRRGGLSTVVSAGRIIQIRI